VGALLSICHIRAAKPPAILLRSGEPNFVFLYASSVKNDQWGNPPCYAFKSYFVHRVSFISESRDIGNPVTEHAVAPSRWRRSPGTFRRVVAHPPIHSRDRIVRSAFFVHLGLVFLRLANGRASRNFRKCDVKQVGDSPTDEFYIARSSVTPYILPRGEHQSC